MTKIIIMYMCQLSPDNKKGEGVMTSVEILEKQVDCNKANTSERKTSKKASLKPSHELSPNLSPSGSPSKTLS